jgi:type IX secretion system PorP/SprF family membrane protein
MKKYIYALLMIVFAGKVFAQQDPQFTQYLFNGLIINPAYAGYKQVWNAQAGYRSQWVGIDHAPVTQFLTTDGSIWDDKIGLGLHIVNDKAGAQGNLSVYTSYAYRLQVTSESNLAFGLSGGFSQYSLDGTMLVSDEADDVAVSTKANTNIIPDARFGMYYNTESVFAGVSITDLLSSLYDYSKPEYSLVARRDRHYFFTGGGLIEISEKMKLKPSFLVKEDFRNPTMIDLNTFLLINQKIWIGLSASAGVKIFQQPEIKNNVNKINSISFLTEYYVNERLRIGYSYDHATTRINAYSNGSHEFTVAYSFIPAKIERMLSPRYF